MYNRGRIITEEERISLHKWANSMIENYNIKSKRENCSGSHYHFFLNKEDTTIPELVWEIKGRLEERENLGNFQEKHYTLKDLLLIVEPGGILPKHTDVNNKGLIRARFNIFISVPKKGCETFYDNVRVSSEECCYVLCRCGIDEHHCSVNTDNIPRISLSFGYLFPTRKLDELTSDTSIGKYRFYPLTPPSPPNYSPSPPTLAPP